MLMSPAQAQRFENSATDAEFDAYLRASDAAEQPALHPDQFRFLLMVMLPTSDMPVPVVATIGVDDRGQPNVDDAWIYLPGQQAVKKHRGADFDRIRAEIFGWHYEALIARAAEIRVPFRRQQAA